MLLEKVTDVFHAHSELGLSLSNGPPSTINPPQTQPRAKRWDDHLSIESTARTNSTLKASTIPPGPGDKSNDIISLGTARPDSQFYPWKSLDVEPTAAASNITHTGYTAKEVPQTYSIAEALNYGPSAGSPQLLDFIKEHVGLVHRPVYADWECSLTCGTTSALEIVLRMLCDRGDSVLAEAFTYSGMLEAAKPLGLNVVGVEMDSDGLVPEMLDETLKGWDHAKGPKPRVLYTIPTGHNPTGTTQPPARKREIYNIAEQHDLIIVEDDPYYFLSLDTRPASELEATKVNGASSSSVTAFLETLPPSYLSLDTSGRVIRLDTTSKILAPGLRCGWITACSQLIEKFLNHTEFSTTSPSGPSQMMMYRLLVDDWGQEGFVEWLMHLSGEYGRRLGIVVDACRRYLPEGICGWNVPTFGMFVWLEVDWEKHPLVCSSGVIEKSDSSLWLEIEDRIYQTVRQNGVQVSKGSWFAAGAMKDSRPPSKMDFRTTFAAARREEDLEEAVKRLSRAVRQEFVLEPTIEG